MALSQAASRPPHPAVVGLQFGDLPSITVTLHALAAWPSLRLDPVQQSTRLVVQTMDLCTTVTILCDPAEQFRQEPASNDSQDPPLDLRRLWPGVSVPSQSRYQRALRLHARQEILRHAMVEPQLEARKWRAAVQQILRDHSMNNHHFLTTDDVVAMLRSKRGGKSLKEFADEIGCSFQFVSQVFTGTRIPGGEMLDYLGVEKVTVYQKVK